MLAIRAGQILTPFNSIEPGIILISDGVILDVISENGQELTGVEVIDATDSIVGPGLIDVHTHGIGGKQGIDGNPEEMNQMAEHYAKHGVTSFLATIGGSNEAIENGIEAVLGAHPAGADILGIHMEGPFLNRARKGAFLEETIIPTDLALLGHFFTKAEGKIRIMTIAPEMDLGLEIIRHSHKAGVICSAGHSQATWQEMMDAIDAGLSHVTHTYNGMAPLSHRDPGILGAALTDDRLTVELIADGIHVHPAAIRVLLRCKPINRVVAISDSIGAAGLPDGNYHFEELDITIANDSARLEDGTLAGGVSSLEKELINLVKMGEISLADSFQITSSNAAEELGLIHKKGRLFRGADADIICLDRKTLKLQWTMARGKIFNPVI